MMYTPRSSVRGECGWQPFGPIAMHTSGAGLPCSSTITPSRRYAVPGFMLGVGVAGLRVGGTKVGSPSGEMARIGDDAGSAVGAWLGALVVLGPQAISRARSGTPR